MNEFIQMAVKQLGASETSVRSATGGMLQMMQGQLGEADFGQLLAKLPGASDVMKQAPQAGAAPSGGGMLGGLMNKASSALGGGGGSAAGLAAVVQQSGLGLDKLGSFGKLFFEFVKGKAGPELTGSILDKVPDLKKLIG